MIKRIFEWTFDKKKKERKKLGIWDMIKRIFEWTFDKEERKKRKKIVI